MKRELLIELGELVESKSETQVDLMYYTNKDPEHSCGTIFCAWGWAVEHPPFQAMGLYWGSGGNLPYYQGEFGQHAAAKFFELELYEAKDLFDRRGKSHYDFYVEQNMSDKELFAHRLKCFLEENK